MGVAQTLFRKIWAAHTLAEEGGRTLIYVDRHFVHEGSKAAFEGLRQLGATVRRPRQTFAFADHLVPTARARGFSSKENEADAGALESNSSGAGIVHIGLADPRQGIVHVVAPEMGLVLPGMTVLCGDSHTTTMGAWGAVAFGIGASEVKEVLAAQALWMSEPAAMRVRIDNSLARGVTAKDLVLYVISKIGVAGAIGHAIEFAGGTVQSLTMEQRMTICNMSVEAGGRCGIIAPDDTTLTALRNRAYAPWGAAWDRFLADVAKLRSDDGAVFDREIAIDAAEIAPMVTWGTNPEQAGPVTGTIPQLTEFTDPTKRASAARALEYMGLSPGQRLRDIAIDRVFIGSCTNGRIEDLRSAAAVARGKRVQVPAIVVPGSSHVKRQAEVEGLHAVFLEAGFEWRDPGCSMCIAINGDVGASGERCASTSNRNFEGRQGKGVRTHLMSPAMAAAAAVTGRLTDPRELGGA